MNGLFYFSMIIGSYLLRPPPPLDPPERDPLDLDGDDDLDALDDLFEVLGDDDLFVVDDLFEVLGDDDLFAVDDLFDVLGDEDLFALDVDGDAEALLAVEDPFLVLPDCDVAGLFDALFDAPAPFPRPACEVEGRVPPLPAVLKFPLLILLFTLFDVFLLLLL